MSSDGRRLIHDCWNRVGVRGDLSCTLLAEHVHCRNCPVYASAAAARLDSELPSGHLEGWAEHFARVEREGDVDGRSIFVFRVAVEWLALPTSVFREIVDVRPVRALPHRRNGAVLGLVNVHGELVVCVSLARWLGIEGTDVPKADKHRLAQARLAVVSRGPHPVAFAVDEVHGTRRFLTRDIVPTPATVSKASGACAQAVVRWGDRSIGLLDDELLFRAFDVNLS